MREFMAICKAVSDPQRVRLLVALQGGEQCVGTLVRLVGLAPSTVSKHLSILQGARLVESRKQGRRVFYREAGEDAPEAVTAALRWIGTALGDDPVIREDRLRLQDTDFRPGGDTSRPRGSAPRRREIDAPASAPLPMDEWVD
ncbi:MAG: winged helix-turn-helix transcriptional regulator [Acidobacteria bacterium]|nr:winged helix-turn-helix transcriptional regulator [Acidobacteriota bacterium]